MRRKTLNVAAWSTDLITISSILTCGGRVAIQTIASATSSATSTENGESEETVETTYDKDPIVIGFNSAYILDFLKALGGKGEIKFCMKDGQSAGLLKPEGEGLETVVCIIMPMRA